MNGLATAYLQTHRSAPTRFLGLRFDNESLDETAAMIAARPMGLPFRYVVNPNVDGVIRIVRDRPDLRAIYRDAWFCQCDSRVLAGLARLRSVKLSVVPGSTLVATMLERYIRPDDTITIVGCAPDAVDRLRARFGLRSVAHHNPPMGFINDPSAVQACVDFVLAHPARYVFLAVGSPQQEVLAARIAATGEACNIGFCVGASLNFLTGVEARAPMWMQRRGLEWLHRLLIDPRRMWRRYLLHCPRIFSIVLHDALSGPALHGHEGGSR